jgi:hypothetical protein
MLELVEEVDEIYFLIIELEFEEVVMLIQVVEYR